MRFYTQGKFSWRKKSLCTWMGGREKSLCTMQQWIRTPNPSWSYSFPAAVLSHFFYINFKHQLLSICMLEHFFRPFLKTRSYDRSAHTFGSSHRFLEVPHKGVLNKWFVGIFYTYLRSPYCYLVGGGRTNKRGLYCLGGVI